MSDGEVRLEFRFGSGMFGHCFVLKSICPFGYREKTDSLKFIWRGAKTYRAQTRQK